MYKITHETMNVDIIAIPRRLTILFSSSSDIILEKMMCIL